MHQHIRRLTFHKHPRNWYIFRLLQCDAKNQALEGV
ncbi:hypothetical protein CaCOL14_005863 [Colletotrichum acutatum]